MPSHFDCNCETVQIDEAEQRGANGGLADDEDEAEGGGDAYMERLARIRERIKVPRCFPLNALCAAGHAPLWGNARALPVAADTPKAAGEEGASSGPMSMAAGAHSLLHCTVHVQAGNHDESDDDSEWTEDEEVSTPVDPVDPFLAFSDAVRHLQSAHPARFQVPSRCWAHGTLVSHVAGPRAVSCKVLPWAMSGKRHVRQAPYAACNPSCQCRLHDAGAGFWAGSGAGCSCAGAAAACRESAGQEGS